MRLRRHDDLRHVRRSQCHIDVAAADFHLLLDQLIDEVEIALQLNKPHSLVILAVWTHVFYDLTLNNR